MLAVNTSQARSIAAPSWAVLMNAASYALGASASGMTFVDSEVPALLGEPLDALLFTCIGVPEYTPARGGLPGAPTAIRTVTPR